MTTQNYLDYSKHGLSNPNLPFVERKYGTAGFIALGCGLSLTVAPMIGCVGMAISLIKMVWTNAQLNLLVSRQKEIKNECLELEKIIFENPGHEGIIEFKKTVKILSKEMDQNNIKIENAKFYRHEKVIIFVASFFAVIPLVGVFMAGYFLKKHLVNIKETGIRGAFEAITQIFFSFLYRIVQKAFFPLSQIDFKTFNLKYKKLEIVEALSKKTAFLKKIQGREFLISIKRENKRTELPIITAPAKDKEFSYSEPLMVIFHGNFSTAFELEAYAKFYQNCGLHVVIVSMAGYPGTFDMKTETNEISSCQDVYSSLSFLRKKGAKKIGVHGSSIGGTRALIAAELFPRLVRLVIADQTFDNIKNVTANHFNNMKSPLPSCFVRGLAGTAFIAGEAVPGVLDHDGKPYKTDGFDNLRKVALLRERAKEGSVCDLFAIRSSHDHLMTRMNAKKEDFAESLVIARYGKKKNLIEIPGGHMSWFKNVDQSNELRTLLFNIFLKAYTPKL